MPTPFLVRAVAVLSACLLGLGCGASPPPEAESPSPEMPEPSPGPESKAEPAVEEPPPEPGAVVGRTGDDSIPDDYAIMSGDCDQLGKQLSALTRSDQGALLSPKLTAAQRAQADKSISDVATKLGSKWTEGCEKSLVGKTVDRKVLKCAFDAKTVKDFDACLNGPAPAK